jgi:hypothetical protein
MANLEKAPGSSDAKCLDTAMAAYALVQVLMARMVEKGAISMTEAAEVIETASRTLRKHFDEFEAAAEMLDAQAKLWRPTSLH